MVEESKTEKGRWISRLWRFLWSRPARYSLGVLLSSGFVVGILFWGGLHWAIELSSTEEFCVSCHEMYDNPYQDLQSTIHFSNRTGIRATCSDCHVPHEWVFKIRRKIVATRELFLHMVGFISTPEKYDEKRLAMATSVWRAMKNTDSRECRNCHENVWMDFSEQFGGAARNHRAAVESGALTCIDCHQGIAHRLPDGFDRPSTDDLLADSEAWLTAMETLARQSH